MAVSERLESMYMRSIVDNRELISEYIQNVMEHHDRDLIDSIMQIINSNRDYSDYSDNNIRECDKCLDKI